MPTRTLQLVGLHSRSLGRAVKAHPACPRRNHHLLGSHRLYVCLSSRRSLFECDSCNANALAILFVVCGTAEMSGVSSAYLAYGLRLGSPGHHHNRHLHRNTARETAPETLTLRRHHCEESKLAVSCMQCVVYADVRTGISYERERCSKNGEVIAMSRAWHKLTSHAAFSSKATSLIAST